jgi:hypothetical protein
LRAGLLGFFMSLAKKLNFKPGMKALVIGRPAGVDLDDLETGPAETGGVLAFARTLSEVDAKCGAVVRAAKADRLAWIAYPNAGQLETDLNRDILWRHTKQNGVQAVRQIAIDSVWSALRFRPG